MLHVQLRLGQFPGVRVGQKGAVAGDGTLRAPGAQLANLLVHPDRTRATF